MKKYDKILVGRHYPENLCFAKDGEKLVLAANSDKMKGSLPRDELFFVGVESNEPSRYGWVKALDKPITSLELASIRYDTPSELDIENCETLLKSCEKFDEGTPMSSYYMDTSGVCGTERILRINKVFFYNTTK